uniref:Cadherin domain-containing protein n=1 Tax=Dicentrarchus labrax TaxID=13489 RepID=A0A8P4G9Y6_DICLA
CVVQHGELLGPTMRRQVLLFISVLSFSSVIGQVSYSIPEEMPKGSFVGDVVQDLGLDVKRLKSGKARIYTGDSPEYIELNKERGVLLVKDRIDREAICAQTAPCALHFQVILENPMEFYSITIEVTDINDNVPIFKRGEMKFRISESVVTGTVFVLDQAVDLDVGINGLQSYLLRPTDNFVLRLQNQADGSKMVEMVLQKPLDRENEDHLSLVLTAVDGGDPQLSGTVQINVNVLDSNDNAPVFTQKIYKSALRENSAAGTIVIAVSASDLDDGSNGKISYAILNSVDDASEIFDINTETGEVRLVGSTDFEKKRQYQIHVQASDEGGLTDSSKVIVEIVDTNDNIPAINVMSKSSVVREDIQPGTVVTIVNIQDPDSGENGKVQCYTNENIPFSISSTSNNFFSIMTDSDLDRERASEYNITVTCSDEGVPSLSSSVTLTLQISDVNDNAPVFERSSYEAYIVENNTPGLSIFTVKARDADWNQNARVSYILEDSSVNGVPVSSYVSVSADSGVIHAVRSFDYEQIKDFQFRLKAQDGGSPPLSSNVSVKIMIQDQNDNPPQVLYPVQTGGSLVAEMVPRSADVGYLVTKVVAVDVDSGQNAWLSYKLSSYEAYIVENNTPGLSIFTVKARDADWNQNARVSYILEDSSVNGVPVSSYVSVSADSGVIHAVRSFDYEQIKDFQFRVKAQDGGSPPLSSNVSVKIMIQDQNDNPPQVLYPVQTGGSLVAEMVPRSADVGYLVTKVVAVDVDSGQNAWLSYKLQKATDRALFEVGLQNGEIRTIRQVTDKDAVKQRLTVIVEDNGQPSRSATVIVNVAVADSFPEVLSEFTDFTHDKEYNDNLTFYLVLALAVVSFLFITCLVVIISVKIYRWRQSRVLYHSNLPVIPYYPPRYSDTLGTGTLQHVYNYEVCRTTDSRKSDCKFGRAGSQNVLIMDPSSTGTMQRIQSEKSILDDPDSPLEMLLDSNTKTGVDTTFGRLPEECRLLHLKPVNFFFIIMCAKLVQVLFCLLLSDSTTF